jgi:hypothetical protein
MSKHTPGPWRTGSLISYNAETGEPEAFVYRLDPDNYEETAHNRIRVRGSASMDCDADARLIAAAPDLYDLLREAVAKGMPYGPSWFGQFEWTARVKATLAKAEGE